MRHVLNSWVLGSLMVMLVGCASTSQPEQSSTLAEQAQGSGFMPEVYPLLSAGKDGDALRVYRNPQFDSVTQFARYKNILLAPVSVYPGPHSALASIAPAQGAAIAQRLYVQLHEQLEKDYRMVTAPGPDTLQVSVAITDAGASEPSYEALSYVPIPVGLLVKTVVMHNNETSTGKPPFAGQVSIEGKIADAQTGALVEAQIDVRVGARHPFIGLFESNTYDSWSDVDEAGRYWAERLRYRLCQRKGGSQCVEPIE
jgi:hypothetical protein